MGDRFKNGVRGRNRIERGTHRARAGGIAAQGKIRRAMKKYKDVPASNGLKCVASFTALGALSAVSVLGPHAAAIPATIAAGSGALGNPLQYCRDWANGL